ncbi:glutathione S-transferase [Roseibacterium sp. SDUM158016]|uniref:glutathione S-transferase n=1 Tax=Roseicyclus sediminis TaxID=2980997 RepID=UPI0021CE4FC1|nr:glutathione S-transferase [Roseibacterium sp. SDUM158016]MCU4654411.1 glutathione S-transferase [Roseibacterium sp. SDUM158016]
MTYRLLIGQRSYSSWSLRGWLPFAVFGIPVEVSTARLYSNDFEGDVAAFGGAGTVPVVRTPTGGILTDSVAIAWHLAEAFPDLRLLPEDPACRAEAQSIIAEMHSGFTALRGQCPMNLRTGWAGFVTKPEVQADLDRIGEIWSRALDRSGGPFLYGEYTLADAFYAPVATRIATYGLPATPTMRTYVETHLAQPDFRRWRALGATEGPDIDKYEMPLARAPFPAPATIAAEAISDGAPENAACPYSGAPVTHLARIGGRVFGFCNAACRDKTVADPEAWPRFMEIYHS